MPRRLVVELRTPTEQYPSLPLSRSIISGTVLVSLLFSVAIREDFFLRANSMLFQPVFDETGDFWSSRGVSTKFQDGLTSPGFCLRFEANLCSRKTQLEGNMCVLKATLLFSASSLGSSAEQCFESITRRTLMT